jgi:hypothetical protein
MDYQTNARLARLDRVTRDCAQAIADTSDDPRVVERMTAIVAELAPSDADAVNDDTADVSGPPDDLTTRARPA